MCRLIIRADIPIGFFQPSLDKERKSESMRGNKKENGKQRKGIQVKGRNCQQDVYEEGRLRGREELLIEFAQIRF